MKTDPHDPTRSGPPPSSAASIRYSRNEIEALSMKAARGAGMNWGLAEEAGFAAGWLAAQGLDGAGALLALFDAARQDDKGRSPVIEDGIWRAPGADGLCPIALGAALSDHAGLHKGPMARGGPETGPVNRPILVVPFLALIAERDGGAISLNWPKGSLAVTAAGIWPMDAAVRLLAEPSAPLKIAGTLAVPPVLPAGPLSPLSGAAASGLNVLAMRTTVPASETSRKGAGAAASDND
ncbi:DUF3726 domain-containing protein [Defluviimonas sp. SAOS-178_SWC]|uniref:DUF3726 domain-containing protein n=1 Tax=Defluviimonas sp. SAOS-178_SWC TaxID=3121287 RepID=UPI003221E833